MQGARPLRLSATLLWTACSFSSPNSGPGDDGPGDDGGGTPDGAPSWYGGDPGLESTFAILCVRP